MIRRDILLADGEAGWALISQIEHARISAKLASHCLGTFHSTTPWDVRREALAAIRCHDDGWADWERAPRLDLKLGRPLSFMELEVDVSIEIWTKSIGEAEEQGPLAYWMVAGHFQRLLEHSAHARESVCATRWSSGVKQTRDAALAMWQARDRSAHTPALADEALEWLWAFDEISLWFCGNCPIVDEASPRPCKSLRAGRETPIEMEFTFPNGAKGPNGRSAGATPYRFDVDAIELAANARIVPAAAYGNSEELLATSESRVLRWRLNS